MPLRLTGRRRSEAANWQLAAMLAFTAGLIDASGFLALRQFTSHVTGTAATLAVGLAAHGHAKVLVPVLAFAGFLGGAMVSALLIAWSRRRRHESLFAMPLLVEALMLAAAAFAASAHVQTLTLVLLAVSMGLQNAIITRISHAEIRTTHITGMITDIGIELGKALYWNRRAGQHLVRAERRRLVLLLLLVSLFFIGAVGGAFAYPHFGLRMLLPLSILLAATTVRPILADLSASATAR